MIETIVEVPMTINSIPWGTSITHEFDLGFSTAIKLSDSDFTFDIKMDNYYKTYYINKPPLASITSYTLTLDYFDDENKTKSIVYDGNVGRGVVAAMYDTAIHSKEILFGQKKSSDKYFKITIPFRYLFDVAESDHYLPICKIKVVLNFAPLQEIFSSDTPLTASIVSGTAHFNLVKKKECSILATGTYALTFVQQITITRKEKNIEVPICAKGKIQEVLYFFLDPKTFNFSNKDISICEHKLTFDNGLTFPKQELDKPQTCDKHYSDFEEILEYGFLECDCITQEIWNKHCKIYAIYVDDNEHAQASCQCTLSCTFNKTTWENITMYVVVRYVE